MNCFIRVRELKGTGMFLNRNSKTAEPGEEWVGDTFRKTF